MDRGPWQLQSMGSQIVGLRDTQSIGQKCNIHISLSAYKSKKAYKQTKPPPHSIKFKILFRMLISCIRGSLILYILIKWSSKSKHAGCFVRNSWIKMCLRIGAGGLDAFWQAACTGAATEYWNA